jgi:hypothetical protein
MFQFVTDAGPIEVLPGATSARLRFPELASDGDPPTIFLRLVALGAASGPPIVTLHTDLTPPLELTGEFAALTGSDGTTIAEAVIGPDDDGTHRIRIIAHQLGTAWALSITNRDPVARFYAAVVADNRDQTRQPWIDVAPAVSFATTLDRPAQQRLPITNRGTGRLTITEPTGGASVLTLTGIPPTGIAPGASAELTLTFTPDAVGTMSTTFTVASNDSSPTGRPPHNHRVAVTSTTTFLTPGTVLVLEDSPQGRLLIAVDPHTGTRRLLLQGQPLLGRSSPMVEADGRLLLVDGDGLVRLDPLSGHETPIRFQPPTGGIGAAALAPDGNVVAFRGNDDAILRLNPNAGSWTVLTGGGSGPRTGIDLAVKPDGTIFGIVRTFSSTVLFRADGSKDDFHEVPTGGNLGAATSLAIDTRGRILVGDFFSTAVGGVGVIQLALVKSFDPADGSFGTLFDVDVDSPVEVRDIAVDSDGQVWTIVGSTLLRWHADTEASPMPATAGVPSGAAVAVAVVP